MADGLFPTASYIYDITCFSILPQKTPCQLVKSSKEVKKFLLKVIASESEAISYSSLPSALASADPPFTLIPTPVTLIPAPHRVRDKLQRVSREFTVRIFHQKSGISNLKIRFLPIVILLGPALKGVHSQSFLPHCIEGSGQTLIAGAAKSRMIRPML